MTAPLLSIRNLRTWFYTEAGVARAVDGVSFDIGAGETLGLVGESGSGKSVTALSILRLIQPPGRIESGSVIEFEGKDIVMLGDDEIRDIRGNRISMIFQEPMSALNPVFSVGDQVAEVARVHAGMSRRDAWDRAVEMLALTGIPDAESRAKQYPHQLSGGMRQRVLIAMALMMKPALVIAETASRVIVMYAGEVVEQAEVDELFAKPQHPYTEGLMHSMPHIGHDQERLNVIPGTVPAPTEWPAGCRFRDRCPYSWDRCEREHPPLYQIGTGHVSRCHLAVEPERRNSPHPPLVVEAGVAAA